MTGIELPTAQTTREAGARLGRWLCAGDLVVLTGELGAGKTTFTQGLAEGLGVRGPVTSPTFVISREHPSVAGGPGLVHVDAYRLASSAEVDDIDLDASLDESVTVIEWGAGLVEQLADRWVEVRLTRRVGGATTDPDESSDGVSGDSLDGEPVDGRVLEVALVGDWPAERVAAFPLP